MKELCKDSWDADYIDKIGEDRQLLYDLILVRHTTHTTHEEAIKTTHTDGDGEIRRL